ncbi:MAG: hypothetical protein EOL95_11705 [Bacteroidia bacterium]|nr:hypothetical protein [Bacteroidia bacterium]
MSMNLYVCARAKAIIANNNKETTITNSFDLWQTPTKVTYACLESEDVAAAYISWVRSVSEDEKEPIYAPDDYLCENDPIGYETINCGENHIKELLHWIKEQDGFEIEWSTI